MDPLLIVLILAIVLLAAVIAIWVLRSRSGELGLTLQNLNSSLQTAQTQNAVLAERLSSLDQLPHSVTTIALDMRSLGERISALERQQDSVNQGLNAVGSRLAQTSAVTNSLVETAGAIRSELDRARDGLTELQSQSKARHELEARTAESIRRLETVIAGVKSKGSAGENLMEGIFAQLPAAWQVRNFRVGNKSVEFGLRLPNDLVLPIDSKWPATNLIEQWAECTDPDQQQRIKSQIEATVLVKARELRKYIDPALTVNFGLAVVPDAVFDLCSGIQPLAFQQNVVITSYSLFLPYLLLVFHTVLSTSHSIDIERLDAHLRSSLDALDVVQGELEGRFSRALTLLANSRDHMSLHLGKARNGLSALQVYGSAMNHGDTVSTDTDQHPLQLP